jgi:UDP-GlcNAc3NAcA epimerase
VKVISVVGARPQFVKAAPVSRQLRARHRELLVHTGQHYDDAMSDVFFRELGLPPPDRDLGVGSGTHAVQTAEMLRRLEPILVDEHPDVVLLYGDTNSTLAGALAAAKLSDLAGRRPAIAHVEAGLRSFNPAMPEERNRIVADHLSDLLLAPTQTAMDNLANEGLGEKAALVGDVMVDALESAAERAGDALPAAARGGGYVLLTLHRPSNVDDPTRLAAWLAAAGQAGRVLFPVHPRTRAVLDRARVVVPDTVILMEPAGYLAMVALEREAEVIATDSGGVQKEAYLAGVPCVTLRGETEWVETVESGWNRLAADPADLGPALAAARATDRSIHRPSLYGDGHAAGRIVDALERLIHAHAPVEVAS